MNIVNTNTQVINWDLPDSGKFTVTVENNVITELSFCEVGSDESKCLSSVNEAYLRNVNRALTDLFRHLDKHLERKNDESKQGNAA